MRTSLTVTLVFLGLLQPAAAEERERLTIDDAVVIAQRHHPLIAAARAGTDLTRARVRQAYSSFLPALTAGASYLPQTANFAATPAFRRALGGGGTSVGITCDPGQPGCTDPQPCVVTNDPATGEARPGCQRTSSSNLPASSTMFSYWSLNAGLQWTLFDFGRSIYGTLAARENRRSSDEGLRATILQVSLDARVAFYAALAADQLVIITQESVATQERHLQQMTGFVEAGTRTRVDLAQSRADLAAAELNLARAHGQRDTARAQLSATLGLETWHAFELVPPPEASAPTPPASFEASANDALARRPEPRQFAAAARAQRHLAVAAGGSFFPVLSFSLNSTFANTSIGDLTPNLQLGLVLSYPAGGMNPLFVAGQLGEARAAARQLDQQARASRNDIRLELAQALAGLTSSQEAVAAARRLEEAARERRELSDARFTAGMGTVLELSDAESSYVNAEAQRVQAELDLGVARARYEKALGR